MAAPITAKASLITAVADHLNRSDLSASGGAIEVAIQLAEQRFQRDPRVREPGSNNAVLSSLFTTDPNWLLTAEPDIYYWGVLCELQPYLRDDQRVEVYEGKLEFAISKLSGSVRLDPNRTALTATSAATLASAVADALNRGDIKNIIAFAVTLAEAGLRKDQRVRSLASTTYSITADDIAVPTTFRNLESWYYDSSPYGPIEIVSPDMLATLKARYGTSGQPAYAAIIAGTFRFAPAPTTTYSSKMTYWQTLTALASGSNWLIASHPDIYLMATLAQMGPWVQGDPNALATVASAAAMLDGLCENLHLETWDTQWSGTMRTQVSPIG